MQTVNAIILVLATASVGTGLPKGPGGAAIGSATECKYMVPWQVEKPGYKWIWACEDECVSWQFSDPSHPECLRQVPINEDGKRHRHRHPSPDIRQVPAHLSRNSILIGDSNKMKNLENDKDPWFAVDGARVSDAEAGNNENPPVAHDVSDDKVEAADDENPPFGHGVLRRLFRHTDFDDDEDPSLAHKASDGNNEADNNEHPPFGHGVLRRLFSHTDFDDDENPFLAHDVLQDAEGDNNEDSFFGHGGLRRLFSHTDFDDDENPFLAHEVLQDAEAKAAEAHDQRVERQAAAIKMEMWEARMWEGETWKSETENSPAVNRLTAESLIEHPKRSAVVPSDNGEFGLYTVSTHEIGRGATNDIRVMNFRGNMFTKVAIGPDAHDACWIPGTTRVLYLKSTGEGRTEVWVAPRPTRIAAYNTRLNHLQLKKLPNGTIVFMAAGLAGVDGKMCRHGPETARRESKLIGSYTLRRKERRTLFYNVLHQIDEQRYVISTVLHNLILSSTLEAPFGACQVGFTSLVDNFAIGPRGVAIIARDQWVASKTYPDISHPYFVDIELYNRPPASPPRPVAVPCVYPAARASCMRQSPDGSMLGFLFQQGKGRGDGDFEGRRVWLARIDQNGLVARPSIHGPWEDLLDDEGPPPLRFDFAGNNHTFFFLGEREGHVGLSHVAYGKIGKRYHFFEQGTTTAYHPLVAGDWSRLLISRSNLMDSSIWDVFHMNGSLVSPLSSATNNGRLFGESQDSIFAGAFAFHAAGSDVMQQVIVMYDDSRVREAEGKTLPWILALNGSAAGSWTDSWKQQFNALAWVQRGFVVILPNLSGSTGYGSSFRKDARKARGQRPVHDLILLIEKLLDQQQYLDPKGGILYSAGHAVHTACLLSKHETINHFCGTILHEPILHPPAWMMPPRFSHCASSSSETFDEFIEDSADMGSIHDEGLINLDQAEQLPGPQTLVSSANYARYTATMREALSQLRGSLPAPRPLFEGLEVADQNESDLLWYRRAFNFAEKCIAAVRK